MVAFRAKKLTPIDTSTLQSVGRGLTDLSKYTEDEFGTLARALQTTDPDPILNTPPPKPRRGTTAYADGTHWNPGSGEGPYWFDGTVYHPMGQGALTSTPSGITSVHRQVFTSSGTYTPTPGMLYCLIECLGGGGGGGGAAGTANYYLGAGGGGAGSYSRTLASAATVGGSQTVTIGAAGNGGAAGFNVGASGGATSVGVLCTANGGAGGNAINTGSAAGGGNGGAAGTGDVAGRGAPGFHGIYLNVSGTTAVAYAGHGGSSSFGGGGLGGVNTSGSAGTGFGSGGGGGALAGVGNAAGGNGAAGLVIITEYCSQ